jgi:Mg2+ and Co2+ transporter CorA
MSKDTDPLVKIISNSIKNYDKLKDVKLNDFSNKISVNSIIVYLTNQGSLIIHAIIYTYMFTLLL